WPVRRIDEALAIPGESFSANQVMGNVFARLVHGAPDPTNLVIDAPMFHHAVDKGLDLYFFSSTAHGYFERRAAGREAAPEYRLPTITQAADKLEAIAKRAGVKASEMVLAFLLQLAPSVRPIVAASSVAQLRSTWKGGELSLAPEIMREIADATGMGDFLRP